MSKLLTTSEIENRFLAYTAARINWEVGRFQRATQTEAETHARISALAELTFEILGSRDEVEAWLEAATEAPDLRRGKHSSSNNRGADCPRVEDQPRSIAPLVVSALFQPAQTTRNALRMLVFSSIRRRRGQSALGRML